MEAKTREEKIHTLRNLISGKIDLKGLRPHKVYIWEHLDNTYLLTETGERMTEEEYKAFSSKNGTHHILLEDFSMNSKKQSHG